MGLLKTAARVGVASSVHGRVQRRQRQRWAHQDQLAAQAAAEALPVAAPAAAAPAPTAPAAAPPASDTAQQLEMLTKLGELKAAGVLTEAEFAAKKAEILGGAT